MSFFPVESSCGKSNLVEDYEAILNASEHLKVN